MSENQTIYGTASIVLKAQLLQKIAEIQVIAVRKNTEGHCVFCSINGQLDEMHFTCAISKESYNEIIFLGGTIKFNRFYAKNDQALEEELRGYLKECDRIIEFLKRL